MSERTAEQIRMEIAEERLRLGEDLDALHAELRPVVLVSLAAAGVVAIGLIARGRATKTAMKLMFRFI